MMTSAESKSGAPQATLAQALRTLRDDLAQQAPPPSVLAAARSVARGATHGAAGAVMRGAGSAAKAPPARLAFFPFSLFERGSLRPWAGAAGFAAVLGLSLLLVLRPPSLGPTHPAIADAPAAGGQAAAQLAAGDAGQPEVTPAMDFVPLVNDAPRDTRAWVLTAELPQLRLAAMGLPFDPSRAAEPLRAELLVAGNGEVIAVRLLP